MHQALYRKWRPRSFDEVYGQEHITSILKYEVENNKLSHAYLFCGSRGTGKTSCAKILAKAVNCLTPKGGSPCGECAACRSIDSGATTDVIEMDAASNNGVDNIRDIRDEVVYSPSNLKYRVYIIDEVHMLSGSAFNALLKTLEEPPEHVVFILATTELHKLPSTIISRCQRFDFRRISTEVLKNHLLRVAKAEGIELEESAANLLAKQAQGGMRDAISLLDLCAGSREKIDDALVNDTVGKLGRDNVIKVVWAIYKRDYEVIFAAIDEIFRSSRDISVFWQDLISVYRDLLVVKTSKNAAAYLDLTDNETEELTSLASAFTVERLSYHCSMLQENLALVSGANSARRIAAELTLLKMCDERLNSSPEAMLSRISEVEAAIASGAPVIIARNTAEEESFKASSEPSADGKKPRRPARPATFTEEDDDEDFRGDGPSMSQSQKKKPSADASATASNAPKTKDTNMRVLKPFRSRAEVLEKMQNIDAMMASFVMGAKWYSDENGRIVMKFNMPFEIDTVKQFASDELFLRVASQVTGRSYSKADLMLECDADQKGNSIIDKILEAAESD